MLTELRAKRSDACLSDRTFDAWRADELTEPERAATEAHLAGCAHCQARRQELDAAAAAFLARYPVLTPRSHGGPVASAKVVAGHSPFRKLIPWAGAGLAAAAGLLLYISAGSGPVAPGEGGPGTRLKGTDRVGFFVRRGERVFEGVDGQRLQPGDQLRFVASVSAPRHVAILSRDAAGAASVYYPTSGSRSHSLAPAQSGPLESAVELDGTLGREQLFGVFCESGFELEPLRAALEREGRLLAPAGCKVDLLELVKERPE